jgi:hypothetical protein
VAFTPCPTALQAFTEGPGLGPGVGFGLGVVLPPPPHADRRANAIAAAT